MTAMDEVRISALEKEVFALRQRVFTLEMGPFATKAQLYRQAGRRFVDQLIADRKLLPEEVPGHKRPMFCTATFYHTRQGRGGLLCTEFGTLVHRNDIKAKKFKCKFYAENRKVTR